MEIAIKFEKYDLGEERFILKPVSVIKGIYDKETELFETDYNEFCYPIDSASMPGDSYFGCLTDLEKLKKHYVGIPEDELLGAYFYECSDNYIIGYFDYNEGNTKIVYIPCSAIEDSFEQKESLDSNGQRELTFDLDYLNELKNINDVDVLHSEIEKIITCIEDCLNDTTAEEINEEKTLPETKNQYSLKKEESKLITLKELRNEVKSVIIGQDKAIDDVTRGIVVNQSSKNPKHKSHMLIIGPSGTGKTEMINIIAKKMGLPFFKADATAYTKEGYVGKSVYSMFNNLIDAADGDIERAQKGILIIDEIDKKLSSRRDDVGGIDVLNSLLKIMDRDIIEVDRGKGFSEQSILFDTSNLTIIFMGAFAELYKNKQEIKSKQIGFGQTSESETVNKPNQSLTNEDLLKGGIPAEFLGRIPIITTTEELSLENLVTILYKSKGCALEEEKEFCNDLGITLKTTKGYINEIAKKAYNSKTGARNLRKDVRESLANAYDEILSGKKVKVLKLTKKTAIDNKKYYME